MTACFGSLVLSILSRWLIQFCLYLALTSCIPEICSSFLLTSLLVLSSLVYPLTLLKSASLQLLVQSSLISWLPMFRYRTVVLVWLQLFKISFGCLYRFSLDFSNSATYSLESVYVFCQSLDHRLNSVRISNNQIV